MNSGIVMDIRTTRRSGVFVVDGATSLLKSEVPSHPIVAPNAINKPHVIIAGRFDPTFIGPDAAMIAEVVHDRGSLAERYLAILEDVAPGARSVSAPALR